MIYYLSFFWFGLIFQGCLVVAQNTFDFHHEKLVHSRSLSNDVLSDGLMFRLTDRYDNTADVRNVVKRLLVGTNGKIRHVYNNAIKGASVSNLSRENMINLLNKKAILYGTPIGKVTTNTVQSSPVWGLDRIDQDNGTLDKKYIYNNTGRGVIVHIVDTGIQVNHTDFGGRATCEFNSVAGEPCDDLHFHGTHVAGTVGGKKYGVAKDVTLVGVKVLDQSGSGSWDGVAAGIDYVTGKRKSGNKRPMVINMSLGGGSNQLVNDASNAAAQAGIIVVVAAGNSEDDACQYSPASAEKVITVGATALEGSTDVCAEFSNQGRCVEIFAPGVDVESASIDCTTCSRKLSGTSMASPHVAGVAALYLQRDPYMLPHQVLNAMRMAASYNKVTKIKWQGTPNLFIKTTGL